MTGQLVHIREKGRGGPEQAALGPVAVLRMAVYEPQGLSGRRLERRLYRAERTLARAGVSRVVLAPDFPYTERLELLRPVDALPLRQAMADVWAMGALELEGVEPRRGRVALSAPRLCPELMAAAERLCPRVRGLTIDAPGGEEFARWLHGRFGLPVAPPGAGADVTLAFGPGGGRWGRTVELYRGGTLGGLELSAPELELPTGLEEQLLALLWERGSLERNGVRAVPAGTCREAESGV